MKAYVLSEPGAGRWRLMNRPDPIPGPGEVLIAVRAASLNYRDLMQARGLYPGLPKKEILPLSDGSGEVLSIGDGVTQFKPGDRVSGNFFQKWVNGPPDPNTLRGSELGGILAEKAVLKETGTVKIPGHLSHEEA